jgi:hypothetical protein
MLFCYSTAYFLSLRWIILQLNSTSNANTNHGSASISATSIVFSLFYFL